MRRLALALAFGLALAAAPVWAQAPETVCSRNFMLGDMHGLIEQYHAPPAAPSPIRFVLSKDDVRLEWEVRQDAPSLDPPGWLAWQVVFILTERQALWARYWADGVAVGQVPFLQVSALPPTGVLRGHNLQLDKPEILRRLLAAEVREVEIVGEDGVSLMRGRIPFASPAALRAGFAAQTAWLAEAWRTRPWPACHEVVEVDPEF